MKNIFTPEVTQEVVERIERLSSESTPEWGKMNVSQMFAHCCVPYEMVYDNIHPKPNGLMRFFLKMAVKPSVVNEKPYPKNSRTAPQFLITDEKEFTVEKNRLIDYLNKTKDLGEDHFEGLESLSFGPMTKGEWNNTFYKHLDHHLRQFSV